MDDNIAKKMLRIFSHTYRINHESYGLKMIPETIILLKLDHFERNFILKIYANIAKNHLQFLATPISTTTDCMTLNFFADTIQRS